MTAVTNPNYRLCAYIKVDGTQCGGAAKTDDKYCRHHANFKLAVDSQDFSLPPLDDPNAIQVAAMRIIQALLLGKLHRNDAYAVFYGLSIARANLRHTTLAPTAIPSDPDDLEALLDRARAEGRAQAQAKAYAQGYRAACLEIERKNAQQDDADHESLAGLLLRELQGPAPDADGEVLRDGNRYYTHETQARARDRRDQS